MINRDLLQNHARIAIRQMRKEMSYSLIKIGGFSLGVAACLLLIIFLRHELSYDKHYERVRDIYRMNMTWLAYDDVTGVEFPAPVVDVLRDEYPQIETAGRMSMPVFLRGSRNLIRPAETQVNHYEEGVYFAEQEALDILEVPMVYGDRATALSKPNSLVISKSKAEKYFPGINPVGRQMVVNDVDSSALTIGGVMQDIPSTSHLAGLHFLYSMTDLSFWDGERTTWCCQNHRIYVRLKPGTDVAALQEKLQSILTNYYLPSPSWAVEETSQMKISLQPIDDIYLNAEVFDDLAHGDRKLIWIFSTAAILILLLACVNFVNLSTARSANRAHEVGIRRTIGSRRNQLVDQFLLESIIYSLISFVLGLFLVWLLLPFFGQMAGKTLFMPWQEIWFAPGLLAASLIIGVAAGLYPASYLSSFDPLQVLRGRLSTGSKNPALRNALVVFQFTSSIVLLIGTGIVFRQLNYILNKKVGFEKDQVLMIQGTNTLGDQITSFKDQLAALRVVHHASIGDFLPLEDAKRNGTGFYNEGKVGIDEAVPGQWWQVDHDYVKTLGMKIKEGRDFSREMATDSQGVLINEAMAAALTLKDPVGKQIEFIGGTWSILGLVEDFHFESFREKVRPVAFVLGLSPSVVSISAPAEQLSDVIDDVRNIWDSFAPHQPLRYQFMDKSFAMMYEDVQRSASIFSGFAGFAIIIACLGLFGLTAYMTEQRRKEIGIRKVLGASVSSIISLISKDFFKLILISICLAAPLGWYIMQRWLEDFAYRIDLDPWIFIVSGVIALLVAFSTMSYHSIRSARSNPVDSLRSE